MEWKLKQQALLTYQGKRLDQMKIETIETTEEEIITSTCWRSHRIDQEGADIFDYD